jgi:Tfp pilus assembly protein PilF
VYAGKGDLENALVQFQKALEIQTRVFGSDHPHVADSKENIGLVFQNMTKKSEARQMFTEAAGIRRKVFGADHPLTKKSERLAAQ